MHRRRLLSLLGGTVAVGGAGTIVEAIRDPDLEAAAVSCEGTSPACPGSDPDVRRIVRYERARRTGADLFLRPSRTAVSLPAFEVSFELVNRTLRTFATNPYDWGIHKRVDGRWYRVAPSLVLMPLLTLGPFDSHTWQVEGSGEDPGATEHGDAGGSEHLSVDGLGGGTYAFETTGWFEGGSPDARTMLAARFEVDGPPVTLTPSRFVVDVDRSGDVVTVVTEGNGGDPATYVLTRAPDADPNAVEHLIPEQAIRKWPLRDALAHADEGVRQVRVEGHTRSGPPFGVHGDEPPVYEYRGTRWRATVETGE